MEGVMGRLLAVTCLALVWPFGGGRPRPNQPPPRPLIGNVYYHCPKCHSLRGGIWGKGPVKHFNGPAGRSCVHDWKEVSRQEFKALAVQFYAVDWLTKG